MTKLPVRKIRTAFLALLILLMSPLAGCTPCTAKVGDLCYDQQDSSMPPLRASWRLLDAETGKGIPGAWISLRWQGITPRGQRTVCERGELGRTDQDGRFSTVGKNGASRIYAFQTFASGYEHLRFEYHGGGTFQAIVRPWPGDLNRYGPWFRSLKELGYHEPAGERMLVKELQLPPDFNNVNKPVYYEGGTVQLMVTNRALPTDRALAGSVMMPCMNAGADNVGYEGENYRLAQLLWRREIHGRFCHTHWKEAEISVLVDSLSSELTDVIGMHSPGKERQFLEIHAPKYFNTLIASASASNLPLTRDERFGICAAVAPYIDQIEVPPNEKKQ